MSDDRYDALLEEQCHALESQINEYSTQQRTTGNEEDSRDTRAKDNDFEHPDYFRPDVELAITIPGSGFKSDERLVSDRTKKGSKKSHSKVYDEEYDAYNYRNNGKFDVDRSKKRTKSSEPSEAVVSGELGNLKSIAQGYADSDSEEEGEVDYGPKDDGELDDDLLEYAMNEIEEVPVSKKKASKQHVDSEYKSFEQEYAEIKKRREKEKKKDKEKRDKEKSRQEKKERKEKERERREKEKRREREEKREREREEKNKEKLAAARLAEENETRSRLVLGKILAFTCILYINFQDNF